MTPLIGEIHRWATRPHVWGEWDCITLLGDWVARWHGIDPAADVRLTYESAAEAQRVYRFLSDPLPALAARLDPVLARAVDPRPGDIGLVAFGSDGALRWQPALKLGRFWACKIAGQGAGACSVATWEPVKVAAAWSVDYVA